MAIPAPVLKRLDSPGGGANSAVTTGTANTTRDANAIEAHAKKAILILRLMTGCLGRTILQSAE
jgi:hypothetical protein